MGVLRLLLVHSAVLLLTALSTPSGDWKTRGTTDWYSSTKQSFTISSASQLAGLASLVNAGTNFDGSTVILSADVNLGDHYWTPIGETSSTVFEGTFDGGSKFIMDIYCEFSTTNPIGLFGYSSSATIKNVHLNGTVLNSYSGSSTYNRPCVGGIVGECDGCELYGNINECSITGGYYTGGILGCYQSTTKITNSSNRGYVKGNGWAGGIVGARPNAVNVRSTIKNCFNTGLVSGESGYTGGIVGYPQGDIIRIINCYNLGKVTNGNGILGRGQVNSYIGNCYNNGIAGSYEMVSTSTNIIVDYCYGRSGYTIGGRSNNTHGKNTGTFTDDGTLTAVSGHQIIDRVTNLVDALNAYVDLIGGDYTLTKWMKGTDAPAVFMKYVTVKFDANGGTISGVSSMNVPAYLSYGELPTATKSGCEFAGWYTSKTGGSLVESTTEVSIETEHTLYAHWLNKYTVTLVTNGGSVSSTTLSVVEGKQYTGLVNATRNGYLFVGWFSENNGGGTQVTAASTILYSSNHNLYAYWKKICTVTFNANGGSATETSRTVIEGDKIATLPTASYGIHVFLGWFTYASGGNQVYVSTVVSDDITFYAHWEKHYTVTFNANGGSVSEQSKVVKEGSTYESLPTATQRRKTFLGWYTGLTDGNKVADGDTLTKNSDHTLYAHWGNYITVKLNPNGGSLNSGEESVTISSSKSNYGTLPTPSKDMAEFNGWYTEQTGGSLVEATTAITSDYDHMLYAHWLSKYTVTLNPNGGTVSPTTIIVTEGKQYTDLVNATRNEYYFVGWFSDEYGGNEITKTTTIIISEDHTIYAQWKKIYTITLDPAGGTLDKTTIEVIEDGVYGTLPEPERENSMFMGWYTNAVSGTVVTETTNIIKNEDHTLYAHWKRSYIISLNATGGHVNPDKVKIVEYGKYGDLPEPTRDDYVFDGWYTGESSGNKVSSTTTITNSDHTLYARWKHAYTVSFETDGGSVDENSIKVVEGNAYGTLQTASRSGYEFVGWFTVDGTQVTGDMIVTASHTLYAHWKRIVTVNLNANGGSISTTKITVIEGGKYGNIPEPTRDNYIFDGWYTEKTGGVLVTEETDVTTAADHTIYAHWIECFTVKLDANGGIVNQSKIKYKYTDTEYGTLPVPFKNNSDFLGWYTEKGNSGSRIETSTEIATKSDHTLYAHWLNRYTVTFNANGGQVSPASKVYEEGDIYDDLPIPTFDDKKFAGWFTMKSGGTKVEETDTVKNGDHTLWARWEETTVTITFDAGDGVTNKTSYEKGDEISLPNPKKDGYKFEGWYLDPDFKEPFVSSEKVDGDITLYAKWKKSGGGISGGAIAGIIIVVVVVVVVAVVAVVFTIKKVGGKSGASKN